MTQPLVSLIPQRHVADCGAATLAMLLGVTYEEVLIPLGFEVPNILRRGVWFTELQRAALTLGATLVLKRTCDLELDEGILQVKFRRGANHVVLLRQGLIFDTDLTCWIPEDYFSARRAKPGALLVRED